jgi:hypothetical protein
MKKHKLTFVLLGPGHLLLDVRNLLKDAHGGALCLLSFEEFGQKKKAKTSQTLSHAQAVTLSHTQTAFNIALSAEIATPYEGSGCPTSPLSLSCLLRLIN